MRGPPGAPRLPQSDLPFPSPEVRGPSHSTSAQSRPRAAAHSAGAPASSRGSRGACVLHLPQGKLGLGPGWAGEGRRPIRPQGGNGAGGPQGPQPRSRLHLGLWAADPVLEPSPPPPPQPPAPGSSRAQVLRRERSDFPLPETPGGRSVGLLRELSDPVGGGGLEPRPRPAPVTPQCLCLSSRAQAVSFPLGRQSSRSPGPRRRRSRRPGHPRPGPGRARWPRSRRRSRPRAAASSRS